MTTVRWHFLWMQMTGLGQYKKERDDRSGGGAVVSYRRCHAAGMGLTSARGLGF